MRTVFYDIETLLNIFSVVFINNAGDTKVFEISHRRNDLAELQAFLNMLERKEAVMVGYNNLHFDWPVLHRVRSINPKRPVDQIIKIIRNTADNIIRSNDRFGTTIWNPDIGQLDLFKINHFDNFARSTSLKSLQFAMKLPDIQEFHVGFDKPLTDYEMDQLIDYNIYDVRSTKDFYNQPDQQSAIKLRLELGEKYGKNFLCSSDSSMGAKIFQHRLEEELGREACFVYRDGEREIQQTPRDRIAIRDVIFDYVNFERPEFQAVKEWMERQTISQTKGVFTEISEDDMGTLSEFANLKKVKGKVKNLNCVIDGFQFDFGTGGIHGSVTNRQFEESETHIIVDSDVTSLYPSIAIENGLYPEHLGPKFVGIYRDMKEERLRHPKGSAENLALKLCLNSAYGNSNNRYSYLYDPKFTMSITCNGQLLLAMLIEWTWHLGELIQANTDGITLCMPRENHDEYLRICGEWEELTNLGLEHAYYSKMFVRDVNNYLAVESE